MKLCTNNAVWRSLFFLGWVSSLPTKVAKSNKPIREKTWSWDHFHWQLYFFSINQMKNKHHGSLVGNSRNQTLDPKSSWEIAIYCRWHLAGTKDLPSPFWHSTALIGPTDQESWEIDDKFWPHFCCDLVVIAVPWHVITIIFRAIDLIQSKKITP